MAVPHENNPISRRWGLELATPHQMTTFELLIPAPGAPLGFAITFYMYCGTPYPIFKNDRTYPKETGR